MKNRKSSKVLSRSKVAGMVGVSRTYITLLIQGKRQLSRQLVGKLQQLALTYEIPQELAKLAMGKGGLEPPRIAAPDPKSGPSASSGTPPRDCS